jgi:hypothetical protein
MTGSWRSGISKTIWPRILRTGTNKTRSHSTIRVRSGDSRLNPSCLINRQLGLILCWLSLIIPGSGALTVLNAQTGAATPVKVQKDSAAKKARVQRIFRERLAASRSGSPLGDDPCEESVPIALEQTLSGTLEVGDCQLDDDSLIDFYSFQGTAGQAISISLNSNDFDTFLFLLDADGEVIAQDDDGGTGVNSRIPDFGGAVTLPTTGTFFIGANAFDDEESGDYTVSLNGNQLCQPVPLAAVNQRFRGALTGADCIINIEGEFFFKDRYTFQGTAGQQLSIAMNSVAVDSHLILHTPSGANRQVNDDSNANTINARVPAGSGAITLTETGTYIIEVGTSESGELGAYSLLVRNAVIPNPGGVRVDFDGDTKTDISIFRPGSGEWWQLRSSDGGNSVVRFGNGTDKLVPADFTGDGFTDLAVWRETTGEWFVLRSDDNSFFSLPFGTTGDLPVPADYDGDGRTDVAVFRPSTATWFVLFASGTGTSIFQFGISEDRPTVADYDGDGKSDVAIYRPSQGQWWIRRSTDGSVYAYQFGTATDQPVPGDYTGDGKTDSAVWRPSTGEWFVLRSEDGSFFSVPFGQTGDQPSPGDYDGDGRFDTAVFRPAGSTWFVNQTTAGLLITNFGTAGDRSVPNAFVP